MKLPNGFGSHRYVYSPILFDSQDLNHKIYLPALQPQLVTPVLTLYYRKRLASANGMEATSSGSLAAAGAACIPYTTTVGWLPSMEWNGVAPAAPGELQTRNNDAGKRAWFSVMEVDWRASRFRCGTSLTLYVPCGIGLR